VERIRSWSHIFVKRERDLGREVMDRRSRTRERSEKQTSG
jgi:hypothetical protein